MEMHKFKRLPNHIGIIPDGNRRWALDNGLHKKDGYRFGIDPGFKLYELCVDLGIKELTFYGFTKDNTKRPSEQAVEFKNACVNSVEGLTKRNAELLVIGDTSSKSFPEELKPYTKRTIFGKGGIKINFLVNYGWEWDIQGKNNPSQGINEGLLNTINSQDISRIDLIIRWGGRRRLSGFLPVQSVYSDFYIIDDFWPDFKEDHFYEALEWYQDQDVTLGG